MRKLQSSKQNDSNKKLQSKAIIIAVIITTIIVTTFTLSKYEATSAGKDNTRVAAPVITMTSGILNLKLDPINKEQEYIFEVSNHDEQTQTEVAMKYNLQIKTLSNLPLEFELYTYDEENQNLTGENLLKSSNITEDILLNVNEQVTHTYLLKIKWRESETNYKFSQEIDYVQILLDSSQVD